MAKIMNVELNLTMDTFNGLNNAIIAYNDIIFAIEFCCDIPSKLEPLKKLPLEELHARREALMKMYKDLEKYFLD